MRSSVFWAAALLTASAAAQPRQSVLKFDFGAGQPAAGYTKVTPATIYSEERGYGLEPGSAVRAVERGGANRLKGDFLTSDRPFYFSVKAPSEGNYRITVTLGDRKGESVTTVKAEVRRLMLARVRTAPGRFVTRTFLVNVRTPRIAGGGEVALKQREKTMEAAAWDDKITLEFTDAHPAVCGLEIRKDDRVPTLFIAGDSTSTDQPREPFNSWGQMLPVFFKPRIAVANHGESGESLLGFVAEKRLDKLMSAIRPGDYLFIQMGHNDQKEKGEGVGAFTTYKARLELFVRETRARGAIPVLVTSMHRLRWSPEGRIVNSLGDYPEAVRRTAREQRVALIDLHEMSARFYEALGPQQAPKAFARGDATHHNNYGSYQLARSIVEGIRDARLPIAKFLYPSPAFDPGRPDPLAAFDIPAEPLPEAAQKPYGN